MPKYPLFQTASPRACQVLCAPKSTLLTPAARDRTLSCARKCTALLLAGLSLLPAGCASKQAPDEKVLRAREQDFAGMASSRSFGVTKGSYLGATGIPFSDASSPELSQRVSMKSRGTFADVLRVLQELSPVTVTCVQDDDAGSAASSRKPAASPRQASSAGNSSDPLPGLEELLADMPADTGGSGFMTISYSGTFRGLLDHIAQVSGYGWDYDRETRTVTLARFLVRTFTIHATPGTVSSSTRITNRTRDTEAASVSAGSTVRTTASSRGTDSQTAQTQSSSVTLDTWKEILDGIRGMLSSRGKVSGSMAAGTVTVCDRPEIIRRVSRYIDGINARCERQVALRVNVYSLELNDSVKRVSTCRHSSTGEPAPTSAS